MKKRALEVLFSTYWTSSGWKPADARSVVKADFELAKAQGAMFDPVKLDHDALVEEAIRLRNEIDPRAVADAFAISLGSRQLEYRSALGSYAALCNFPSHPWSDHLPSCGTCGTYVSSPEEQDLNILNFERHKWGGVRHLDPLYAVFDLQQFRTIERLVPKPEDVALLNELLTSLDSVPDETSAAKLQKAVPLSLRSNKAERDVLIGILGLASILETSDHRGFLHEFVPADGRELPDRRFVDMAYPACWWVGKDGVNWEAADQWFSHLCPTKPFSRSRIRSRRQ
jgi:hypothetical protein